MLRRRSIPVTTRYSSPYFQRMALVRRSTAFVRQYFRHSGKGLVAVFHVPHPAARTDFDARVVWRRYWASSSSVMPLAGEKIYQKLANSVPGP